jgi:sugar phosphate isomerase/epimerase
MNRRNFIQGLSLLPLSGLAVAAPQAAKKKSATLKVSLNAYSFNKLLNDAIRGRGEGVTLMQLLDFCAKNKFDGFDATGYFMPGYPAVPPDSYIDGLKKKAADLGIGISGTGVRNNFTTADAAVRQEGVNHIKQYVEVAARLGAPVIRVFADTQMRAETWESVSKGATRAQVQDWIAANLRECADHAAKFKVKIGVQNHGDFLKTGQELLTLIKAVGSPWCGPIVDTGYFKTPDPYVDIALVAPTSVNWQVKQSPLGEESEVPTDLSKLLRIVRRSGYTGYLPIETLSPRGQPYDPYAVVPAFLKQLRDAIAQTA